MHFQRELRETSPEARWAQHRLKSSKEAGGVSVAYSGGQPQMFQLFLTLPGFVQMFRPRCYGAFPNSLLNCCVLALSHRAALGLL